MSPSAQRPDASPPRAVDPSTFEALRASERMLAEAQRLAGIGSWSWDVRTDVITWSDELYRIYGLEPGSVAIDFAGFIARVHPDDRELTERTVGRALETGEDFQFDHRLLRPDGEIRVNHGRGTVIRDAAGRPVRMVGTGQDVTEQRAAAERARALEGERARRAQVEAALDRLRFLARAGEILASSLDYEETLGNVARLAVPEMADWCAVDLVDGGGDLHRLAVAHQDPDRVQQVLALEERWPSDPGADHGVHRVIRTGEPEHVRDIPDALLEAVARDPEHLAAVRALGLRSYVCAPLRARGRTVGALTVVHAESERRYEAEDFHIVLELAHRAAAAIENARLVRAIEDERARTEEQAVELEAQAAEMQELMEELEVSAEQLQQRAEELEAANAEAERARAAAEEANEAKSQFLAAMSHELRTPLNAIAGYTELLELGIHGPVSEKQLETLRRIRRNQTRLLGLINDVLNFAKLEAGQVPFARESVVLDGVLAAMDQLIQPQVDARGLTYGYERCEPGITVIADPEKLEQVLLNLLSNAVKFTPAGGAVRLSAEERDGTARVHVRDTGRGIPPDRLENIFEPFVQVDAHLTREAEGVGLGLAISRDLMRRMGGDITVASTPGQGSVFTVHLPMA